jgi:tryptophan synthase alpha chain
MKIQELFKLPKQNLLNIYFTAGYPELESLPVLLESLAASGVDMVEIGLPYSDPLSDGPVIQNSSSIALKNGINLQLIFDQLAANPTSIPKIMMGYFNTVLQFGVTKFCQMCEQTGVSGIILPDLPIDIYLKKYKATFEKHGLSNIFLITPETSEKRIRYIDQHSTSFIYAVSSSSTTGKKKGIREAENYLDRIGKMDLEHPIMVGFNIATPEDFAFACKYAQGGIIGSAFIKHISSGKDLATDTAAFIKFILNN